ncbi:hypothetical protein QBE52_07885 [Clostridiaceae bacterium 35-E11]
MLFKGKTIEKSRRKNLYKIFTYGICIILLILLLGYGVIKKQGVIQNEVIKKMIYHIQNKQAREEIFGYLKTVQIVEDGFYEIVNKHIDLGNNGFSQDQNETKDLEEALLKIDTLILDLTKLDTNDYMQENHQLFFEEIKVMRDVIMEEKLGIENQDKRSFVKAKEYLKKYKIIAEVRRQSLQKVFDRYDIVYIDLGNRIKYKIK